MYYYYSYRFLNFYHIFRTNTQLALALWVLSNLFPSLSSQLLFFITFVVIFWCELFCCRMQCCVIAAAQIVYAILAYFSHHTWCILPFYKCCFCVVRQRIKKLCSLFVWSNHLLHCCAMHSSSLHCNTISCCDFLVSCCWC